MVTVCILRPRAAAVAWPGVSCHSSAARWQQSAARGRRARYGANTVPLPGGRTFSRECSISGPWHGAEPDTNGADYLAGRCVHTAARLARWAPSERLIHRVDAVLIAECADFQVMVGHDWPPLLVSVYRRALVTPRGGDLLVTSGRSYRRPRRVPIGGLGAMPVLW